MEIYEFRSDISSFEDNSEPCLTVETELFLSKKKAIEYMRSKALEYEKANSMEKFYRKVEGYPIDSENIVLESSRNSDVYAFFAVDTRLVNE